MKFTGFVVYGVLGLSIAAGYRSLLQITPAQNFNPVSISVTSPPYDVIATPITPVAPYSQAAYQCNVTGDPRFPIYATGTFPLTVSVPIGQRVRVIFANGNLNGATVTQQGQPGVIVQQGGVFIVQQAGGASPIVQNPGSPVVQPSTPYPPAALVVQQSPTIVQQNPPYPTSPISPPTQFTPPVPTPGQPTTPTNPPSTPTNPPTTPAPTPAPTTRPPTPAPTTPPPTPPPTPAPTTRPPTPPPTPAPTTPPPTPPPTPAPTTPPPTTPPTPPPTSTPAPPTPPPTTTPAPPTPPPTTTPAPPTPPPTSTPAPPTPPPTTAPCTKAPCAATLSVCLNTPLANACVEVLQGTPQACCCCPSSGGKRHLLEESSEVASKGRNLLQNTVPGGPNNGLVEYVGLIKANTVPGFVVPNTQFGVPYVEFTASAASAGQTAVFQGSLLVANVVGGVPQYPFTPNLSLSPQCQVNVNFLTLGSSG